MVKYASAQVTARHLLNHAMPGQRRGLGEPVMKPVHGRYLLARREQGLPRLG
ncbi:hypothetical protein [Nocardia cyriacigeorgica]|uniref:hypothetical protein n=1 Tax=Nocardia cyriacigeorgica TaxID=135487 RepID=UPI00189430AD|nr:hypothetical protein [Nocardia cyriacigeorgica]MBF6495386.1 hypothetical protein [Nocardia cyriacigeorgica]